MKNKIDLLSRILKSSLFDVSNKKQDQFIKLVSKIRELNTFRNKVLHANWMSASRDGTVRTRIVIDEEDGSVLFKRAKISPELINKKSEECWKTTEKLEDFLESAFNV
ncbi:MAG: hypothetical protein Q7S32_04040 [bacterium]|nr:hypothetical protein [bacterium]